MTREEAIKILERAEGYVGIHYINGVEGPYINPCLLKAIDLAISSIRDQEERRWIPVTERMPEPGERVLATDGGFVGELYVNRRGQWQRYNVNDHSLLMALDILWRHEIVHAFLLESGLAECSGDTDCWAQNEAMVDWFARQGQKIYAAWLEAGALDCRI